MRDVVVVSAFRTPIGSFGGALAPVSAVDLGVTVVKALLEACPKAKDQVDELIFGNVLQAGLGQNVARQVSIHSGIAQEVSSFTVNKVCGSGLKSIALGVQAIQSGNADVVIAGGTESMSNAPFVLQKARWGYRMGDGKLVDEMIKDGLWEAFNDVHMGITAENIAERFNISREDQDAFAAESQQKAVEAIEKGYFKKEIVPVSVPGRKGKVTVVDTDEYPRPGTTAETLAKLRPAFKKDGTVTAGNASGINDGAAAVLLMSKEKAQELGLTPLATVVGYASRGVEPAIMGTGPIAATRKVLEKTGMKLEQIELIEANEAFASQSLSVQRELGLNTEILNVCGGAIALGHPIGASGARIFVTLLHQMERLNKKVGLATLCIGGGMGIATIVRRG